MRPGGNCVRFLSHNFLEWPHEKMATYGTSQWPSTSDEIETNKWCPNPNVRLPKLKPNRVRTMLRCVVSACAPSHLLVHPQYAFVLEL